MGRILLAYDGSETSEKAIEKTLPLVQDGDILFIIMVIPTAMIKEFTDFDSANTKERFEEKLSIVVADLKGKGIDAVPLISEGDVTEEILEAAKKNKCDLIVIGYSQTSKIGAFRVGDVAEMVTRHAPMPVMVMR